MSSFRARRPSAALVISVVALIMALGGTAYAGVTLGKNSVGTKQLKKNAVTTSKIKNGQVTTSKLRNGAVTASKINPTGLTVPNATNAVNATNAANAANAANASKLNGLSSSAFLGAANVRADGFATSAFIDNFTSSTFTPIATKTFTAPTGGFAFISATLSTEADNSLGGIGFLEYQLALDGTQLEPGNIHAHEITTDTANHVESGSGAITEVVPVAAGSHTVDLVAREAASGDFIEGRDISILFVPNGSASATPFSRVSAASKN